MDAFGLDLLLLCKSILDNTNYFLLTNIKNNKIIPKYFLMIKKLFLGIDFKRVRMIKICCTKCKNYKEYKKPKVSNICDKRLFFYSICNK